MANRRNVVAVEDCLKAIYSVGEWDPSSRTVGDIAARLRASTSSVSELVKRLTDDGLVEHERYGTVALTDAGLARALQMVRRHRLIETYLVTALDYGWDEVHDEAEVLEHALSDRLLDRIDEQLGYPTRDPHGDPIPSRDGRVEQPEAVLLRVVAAGETVRIVRISDRDPQLLRHLEAEAVALDGVFTVVSTDPFVVRGEGAAGARTIAPESLDSVWVSRSGQGRVK